MTPCFWQGERKKYEKKSMRLRSLYFSSFIFTKKSRFHWNKPSEKGVIAEEKINRFDIDGIENLEGSPRFVFINEECGNLKVVNDGGELARDIKQKKKSDVSQKPVDVHSVTNVGESISSITIYNIVNQLGKRDFSYGSVVHNLKAGNVFFIKSIEIALTQFLPDATGIVLPCRI